MASFAADFSDAVEGAEPFSVWLTEALSRTGLGTGAFSAAGVSEIAATGSDAAPATDVTAAKASASPAPNRSSRPGAPRSRAVLVRMARTSSGFSAGLRSSNRAAMPLT